MKILAFMGPPKKFSESKVNTLQTAMWKKTHRDFLSKIKIRHENASFIYNNAVVIDSNIAEETFTLKSCESQEQK